MQLREGEKKKIEREKKKERARETERMERTESRVICIWQCLYSNCSYQI
jgi:hypothetical protein